jgi:hypothetical protein
VGPDTSIEAALERGASRLTRWSQDGTLIAPQQLAKAWDQDLRALQTAVQRGDLFEVWVDKTPYFAAVFTALGIEATAKVCQALGGLTASAKLLFLIREHGALNGQTVLQALKSGTSMGRIEELSRADVAGA